MRVGTLIKIWLRGKLVGTDEFGNRYYTVSGQKRHSRERRWVLYKGYKEASKVPADWHAWMHHTVPAPLTEKVTQGPDWQQGHQPNPTGTPRAYRPRGHDLRDGRHAPATADYEAWRPDAQ